MKPQRCAQPPASAPEHLPDPVPVLENLARGALEALAGVREVEQLARWLSEDAFAALLRRVNLAARARSARALGPTRPVFQIRSVRYCAPASRVVEAALVVATPPRTRAIAIRLETVPRADGHGFRWRATSLTIL